jgi:hypothetical protein
MVKKFRVGLALQPVSNTVSICCSHDLLLTSTCSTILHECLRISFNFLKQSYLCAMSSHVLEMLFAFVTPANVLLTDSNSSFRKFSFQGRETEWLFKFQKVRKVSCRL